MAEAKHLQVVAFFSKIESFPQTCDRPWYYHTYMQVVMGGGSCLCWD